MIKLTIEDLQKVQDLATPSGDEEDINRLVLEVDACCDETIKDWAKKYAVSSLLGSAMTGAGPLELLYNTLIIGMYMGARMQEGKTEQTMTVRLQFQPGGTNLH
jgi:hypothetical protein